MARGRPTGVMVIGVLAAGSGMVSLVGGFAMIGMGILGNEISPLTSLLGFLGGFGLFAIGILSLYAAWGVWNLKPWAWRMLLILSTIGIAVSFLSLRSSWVSLVTNALILVYLFQPRVRAAFGIYGQPFSSVHGLRSPHLSPSRIHTHPGVGRGRSRKK